METKSPSFLHASSTTRSSGATRRAFLRGASFAGAAALGSALPTMAAAPTEANVSDQDRARMRELAKWTALTFETANPVTYGACLALFNDPRMKKTIERWKAEK